jgi:hypothetical protein
LNDQYVAHLERALMAFVTLVERLETCEPDPRWATELKQARTQIEEARAIAFGQK